MLLKYPRCAGQILGFGHPLHDDFDFVGWRALSYDGVALCADPGQLTAFLDRGSDDPNVSAG